MINQLLIPFFILLASFFIYLRKYLTLPGTMLTAVMALCFYLHGGLSWLLPPLTFFILSTVWTKILGVSSQKDKTRKFVQVFANGGAALILVLLFQLIELPELPILFVSVFAAASADTWATEFGGRFGGPPLSLRSFRLTQSGESGAITLYGTLASLAGAVVVSLTALLANLISPMEFIIVSISGLSGSIFDSVLGAWIQVIWINDKGNQKEELSTKDKIAYTRLRGLSIVNNDVVNFLSTCFSVVVTLFLIQYFR